MEYIDLQEETCEGESYDFFGTPITETGTYFATIDCKSYQLDLTVIPPQEANTAIKKDICEGESFVFFGTNLNQEGHYIKIIDCSIHELDLTVNPRPSTQCSNDTIVEYGNLVKLTASGADSYLWSTGETTESITIYPVTDMTYTVTGFSHNGCSSNASVLVKVINEADKMVLYPNPADNRAEIYKPLIDEVEVFNLLGVRMDRIDAHRQVVVLDVSQYASGIYTVHIRCLNNHYFQKLVIRH